MNKIDEIKEIIYEKAIVLPIDDTALSESAISEIERFFKLRLPATYKSFIREFGRFSGKLFDDTDFHYPVMLDLREELEELIEEVIPSFELPGNAFVFSGYQGYQYHFFMCCCDNDPAVYSINDGGKFEKLSSSFTKYLVDILDSDKYQ